MAMDGLFNNTKATGMDAFDYAEYASIRSGAKTKVTKAYVEKNSDKDTKTENKSTEESLGAVFEKSEEKPKENKGTYSINKMSAEDRVAIVKQMKQAELDRQSQLSQLVQDMLGKQAGKFKLANLFKAENLVNVTAEDIAKAKEDVAEDGYYGVKQTSQRLFEFASALAGDDVEAMKKMQNAMLKGFKEATKAWGEELPQISKDTLDAANKLFDDYYASRTEA